MVFTYTLDLRVTRGRLGVTDNQHSSNVADQHVDAVGVLFTRAAPKDFNVVSVIVIEDDEPNVTIREPTHIAG